MKDSKNPPTNLGLTAIAASLGISLPSKPKSPLFAQADLGIILEDDWEKRFLKEKPLKREDPEDLLKINYSDPFYFKFCEIPEKKPEIKEKIKLNEYEILEKNPILPDPFQRHEQDELIPSTPRELGFLTVDPFAYTSTQENFE